MAVETQGGHLRPFQIDRIFLDEESEGDWVAQVLLKNLPSTQVDRIRDKRALIKGFPHHPDPLGAGKRTSSSLAFMEGDSNLAPGPQATSAVDTT